MIQTRSEENGIDTLETLEKAISEAKRDPSIWKISFNAANGERIRLVKNDRGNWILENLIQ